MVIFIVRKELCPEKASLPSTYLEPNRVLPQSQALPSPSCLVLKHPEGKQTADQHSQLPVVP